MISNPDSDSGKSNAPQVSKGSRGNLGIIFLFVLEDMLSELSLDPYRDGFNRGRGGGGGVTICFIEK